MSEPRPAGGAGASAAARSPFPPGVAPGARPELGWDPYRRSAEVLREATKWIVAFVPGAGLIVTLANVVPDLAELAPERRMAPAVLVAVAAASAAVALVFAARVLVAAPPSWPWIVDTYGAEQRRAASGRAAPARSLSAELDRSGVLLLYGYESARTFFDALSRSDPATLGLAPDLGAVIVDFATLRRVRGRFVAFLAVGTMAAVAAVAAVTAAQALIAERTPAAVEPLRATVVPTATGTETLARADCAPDGATPLVVWLVAGTLASGTVVIDDPACPPASLRWRLADGVLVPAPR